jgi:predicted AAA+ superfamily ATPase
MDVGSHHTAQTYVKALAESFALLVIHYWDLRGSFEPRKQRKVYFLDPLFADVHMAAASGARTAPPDGILEGIVASALFRSASEHLTQSDPTIGSIGYWRSSDGREIDFVVDDPASLGGINRLPIEIKGDASAGISAAVSSIRRTFKRGIVVTRSVFDPRDDILVVPAAVFLAGLPERTERRLSTL